VQLGLYVQSPIVRSCDRAIVRSCHRVPIVRAIVIALSRGFAQKVELSVRKADE
jgi:hypothetical protein